jgi:hypothetical protein
MTTEGKVTVAGSQTQAYSQTLRARKTRTARTAEPTRMGGDCRASVCVKAQVFGSCLVLVVAVAAVAMGCGGGGEELEVDPRELIYCGGTCYMACCADSHDTCPDLMPLEGSECEEFFGACGYGCSEGRYYGASCNPQRGWTIVDYSCWEPPWDAGMTPDATDSPDATGDLDGGEGNAAVDAAVDADGN